MAKSNANHDNINQESLNNWNRGVKCRFFNFHVSKKVVYKLHNQKFWPRILLSLTNIIRVKFFLNRGLNLRRTNSRTNIKNVNLNFGPNHPAAHGVLRLVLQLNNEIILNSDPHIGLLHRGTEKLMETKMYLLSLPYFDRLDYVSVMIQEHAYCLGIESLLKKANFSANYTLVRTLFDELTRILNHMLAICCHALDVGAMSPIFWGFEEREKIMEFYERVSGARMHAAFYRPHELNLHRISSILMRDINWFLKTCYTTLNEINDILQTNHIWKQRLTNIGTYGAKDAIEWGLTGVMLRCTGVQRDVRLDTFETYANYSELGFKSFYSRKGDSYDRYLLRLYEMFESLNIIETMLLKLIDVKIHRINKNNILQYVNNNNYSFITNFTSMEQTIRHFKYWSEGFVVKNGVVFANVESGKGEFGITLIADNTNKPYRCKVRSPAYHHLQILPKIVKKHMLADLVTLMGTIDIVFGEIDR